MSSSDYTITMPLRDYERYKEKEQELNNLKQNIINAFKPDDNIEIMEVDIKAIINIGKKLLPLRYQEWNYKV